MAKRGMSQSILKIDINAIYDNWQSLDKKSSKNVETAAVIKADAYGLSTKNIAPILAAKNIRTFFVAIAEEGIAVRKAVGNDAAETFEAILGEDPESALAFVGLFNARMGAKKINDAKKMLEEIPDTLKNKAEILTLQAQIDLSNQAEGVGEVNDLRLTLTNDENNHQARFDLALALFTKGEANEAIQELLTIFRSNQEWNDDAARHQLFKFFDILGSENPITLSGRRQLASMIFA